MSRRLLFVAVCLWIADVIAARPARTDADTRYLAAKQAARHPNKDLGNVEECQELVDDRHKVDEGNPLNAVVDPNLLWPNNTVYYTIVESGYTTDQIALIQEGILDLQRLTQVNGQNCIFIEERQSLEQTDYVFVENYSGCSSYVGRVGGRQRISLVDSCVTKHGTIMHEFLHAFGFHHEQKRTDRDDWVIINWGNIQPGYLHNFEKLDETEIDLLGTLYDYGSVMHYGAYAFAVDPTVPTIITIDETAEIGQRVTLSAIDIERVQILYECLDPADSVYFKHLSR